MRKSKEFLKLAGVISGIIVGLGALYYLFPFTVFSGIEEASRMIREARSRIMFFDLAARESEQNEKRILGEEKVLEAVHAAFLDRGEPLQFIESIELIARNTGVHLSLDLLGEGEEPAFRLTVLGSAFNAFNFLKKAENAPIIFSVQQMVVDRLRPEEASAVIPAKNLKTSPEVRMVILLKGLTAK